MNTEVRGPETDLWEVVSEEARMSGPLTHAERVAVRARFRQFRPDAPPQVRDEIGTLNDAIEWAGEERERKVDVQRGTYRSPMVYLRSLEPSDVPILYRASMAPESAQTWRFRGRTVSPQSFEQSLWTGVSSQFGVCSSSDDSLLGIVAAYDTLVEQGHTKLAFQRCGESGPGEHGALMEGVFLFIEYLFNTFAYRKLCFEMPEPTYGPAAGLVGRLGCLANSVIPVAVPPMT